MRLLALIGLILGLAACTGMDSTPVKTGGDLDELRKSPCACGEVIQPRSQWVG